MRIKGKVAYAYTSNPDTQFDPAWKVSVVVDKAERDKITEATGLKFTRTDGDLWEGLGDYKLNVKRNVEGKGKRAGIANPPPKVAVNGEEAPEGLIIGNGSVCEVEFSTYNWEYLGRSGVSADFKGINVLEMVDYESAAPPEGEKKEDSVDDGPIKW